MWKVISNVPSLSAVYKAELPSRLDLIQREDLTTTSAIDLNIDFDSSFIYIGNRYITATKTIQSNKSLYNNLSVEIDLGSELENTSLDDISESSSFLSSNALQLADTLPDFCVYTDSLPYLVKLFITYIFTDIQSFKDIANFTSSYLDIENLLYKDANREYLSVDNNYLKNTDYSKNSFCKITYSLNVNLLSTNSMFSIINHVVKSSAFKCKLYTHTLTDTFDLNLITHQGRPYRRIYSSLDIDINYPYLYTINDGFLLLINKNSITN